MGHNQDDKCKELLQAQSQIWNHIFSYINSSSLKCAVELGIPDAINNHGKAMTIYELIPALSINPAKAPCLARLMRVLVLSGFFCQQKTETQELDEEVEAFSLTPTSKLFLKEEPLNPSAFLMVNINPIALKSWNFLGEWFKNDDVEVFSTAYQMPMWEFIALEPGLGATFNEAMAVDSRMIANILMEKECDGIFEGLESLVDVGGGIGTLAKAIAGKFSKMKCTVFDMPQVVGDLKGTENLEFVAGDMFVSIPPANAILLKWILHNWGDEECLKILRNCKEAINSKDKLGNKLIIIDMVVEKKGGKNNEVHQSQIYFDMLMMVNHGGKERNEREWANLFSDAGFSHFNIRPVLGSRSIIEVYP